MFPYVNIHTHHVGEGINILNVEVEAAWANEGEKREEREEQEVFYSVGIHPMDLRSVDDERLSRLGETVRGKRVLAIGECGLDHRSGVSVEEQKRTLMAHVRLAEETRKPLVIHCVKAYSELMAFHKKSKSTVPWIIHGFNNNERILNKLLEHGFYISIGAALLDPRSNAFQLIRNIPLESLFLENDDDEISIGIIYGAASCMVGRQENGLREILWENYNRIFNK